MLFAVKKSQTVTVAVCSVLGLYLSTVCERTQLYV